MTQPTRHTIASSWPQALLYAWALCGAVPAAQANSAPVPPAPIAAKVATEWQGFTFTAPPFTDPDGDTLTYSFQGLPAWLKVSAPAINPRYISGVPPYSTSSATTKASYTITYRAQDPSGANRSTTFTLSVVNVDPPPIAPTSIPAQTATERVGFAYVVPAFSAPDGDALTYTFSGLPAWLKVSAPTINPRYLSGTPPYSESTATLQKSYTLTATARDPAGQTTSKTFTLAVVNVDPPPVAPAAIPSQAAAELTGFSYVVPPFSAPDGDVLTYTFSGLPAWLRVPAPGINPRYISGTPPQSETTAGAQKTYTLTVTATDPSGKSASKSFGLKVYDSSTGILGLDTRPANASCVAPPRPTLSTSVQLTRVFPNLTFTNPVGLAQAPGDSSRWFVWEQAGVVKVFSNSQNATTASTVVDITARVRDGGEMGLLGLAFHPDWPGTPEVFLSYTRYTNKLQSVLSRFTSADGGLTLNAASEQVLLTIDQPDNNHNGGNIVFGPDRMLYFGLGDGGGSGDPGNRAQTLTTLLGKMLRINVIGTGAGYTIPAGNPYAGNTPCTTGTGAAACPEIWAFGFRNPWRWSFDRATGDLWVGDVGQNLYEEVDRVTRGGNYGWRQREGAHCYNPSTGCATPGSVLNGAIVVDPVTEYDHTLGSAITGGYVYRGTAIPGLVGQYIFGDEVSGRVWSHTPGATGMQRTQLLDTSLLISSFGEGTDGELYALNYVGGQIYQLRPGGTPGSDTIPTLLSQTGCVDPANHTLPYAGLIPFQPNAPFWSDGAAKERFLALPDGQAITETAGGDWDFPNGAVLIKNFRLNNKLIETRLFMRHPDGEWGGYTYEWNDAQTDATRVVGGKSRVIGAQTWVYPGESQCLQCHSAAAGGSLGLETSQQNGNLTYPHTGRTGNQVMTLNAIGAIAPTILGTPTTLPALRNPYGTAGTLTERARAYLHSNCSQCHRPGGPAPTNLDFRYGTALSATNACNALPSEGDLGVADARVIAPGAPERSLVLKRVQSLDPQQRMPPLGSTVQDAVAVQLLTDWIQQLANCN